MNFKRSYLFPALSALAALGAFSGTASAAECGDIQSYITANPDKVQSALLQNYGDDNEHRVRIAGNAGGYDVMTISTVSIQRISLTSCTIDLRSSADKMRLSNGKPDKTLGGTVKFTLEFDPSQGSKLCVKSVRLTSANWRDEGAVRENQFVKDNAHKKFFEGCLL